MTMESFLHKNLYTSVYESKYHVIESIIESINFSKLIIMWLSIRLLEKSK